MIHERPRGECLWFAGRRAADASRVAIVNAVVKLLVKPFFIKLGNESGFAHVQKT